VSIPPQTARQHTTDTTNTTTYLAELSEYLSLLALSSPRLLASDKPDPFISRYSIPDPLPHPTATSTPALPPQLSKSKTASSTKTTGSIIRLRYHGFIPAAYVVRLFVLLSKGLESSEANEHEGQARSDSGAGGAILAQGFGGGAVSVLRLACPRTSNGGFDGDLEVVERSDQHEDEDDEGDVMIEAGAKIDGAEEGTRDDGDEEAGDQDVSMEDAKETAGEAHATGNADSEDNVSGALTPDTATSQSRKQGTRSGAMKEKQGARIVCWEYPAPML